MLETPESLRVVIAESGEATSKEIIRAVQAIGFHVVGDVGTGRQAAELTRISEPDLVLMDTDLPEMDGITGARLIQEYLPTPVIILTGDGAEEPLRKARDAGVVAYLTKPPDPDEIRRAAYIGVARFRDLMEIHRLNEELIRSNWKLREAATRIETLEGILPLCSSCRRIPDDDGEWVPLESYVSRHTRADFSHGYCPTCESRLLEEIDAMPLPEGRGEGDPGCCP